MGGQVRMAPHGSKKKAMTAAEKAAEREETWARIQKDPRPFDPKLGDQAVKLLDKAITTFRNRRAAVMQQLDDDVQTIKWSKHEIAWIDKKVKEIKDHQNACEKRFKEVDEALRKF